MKENIKAIRLTDYVGIPFEWGKSALQGSDCIGLVNLVLRDVGRQELPTETVYTRDDYLDLRVKGLMEIADELTIPATGSIEGEPLVALLSFKSGNLGGVGLALDNELLFTDMIKSRVVRITRLKEEGTVKLLEKRRVKISP